MSRRLRISAIGAIVLVGATAFYLRHEVQRPGRQINRTNYDRIENGMSLQQVCTLVGEPDWMIGQGYINVNWASETMWIQVGCENNRVVAKRIFDVSAAPDWFLGVLAIVLLAVAISVITIRVMRRVKAAAGQAAPDTFLGRYRWRLFAVCLAVGGPVLCGRWLMPAASGDRLILQNYQRIRTGMTPADVQSLMGGPPGSMTLSQQQIADQGDTLDHESMCGEWYPSDCWAGDSVAVSVMYVGGTVDGKRLQGPVSIWRPWLKVLRGLVAW